jgi:hypothetical protein
MRPGVGGDADRGSEVTFANRLAPARRRYIRGCPLTLISSSTRLLASVTNLPAVAREYMGALLTKWVKWIAVVMGAAGMLTPALIELGWIPEHQATKAVIFLLGFIVLEGATGESKESAPVPELVTSTEDFFHTITGFVSETKHELMNVAHGKDITAPEGDRYLEKGLLTLRRERHLHAYAIIVARIAELSEESFRRRFAIERDPSLEGRIHYRVIDSPISFGCYVFDQRHWAIDFPPNPADPLGAAIVFRNHPEGARLVASFIRHQWLERPGVTMSLSEAYETWKAAQNSSPRSE